MSVGVVPHVDNLTVAEAFLCERAFVCKLCKSREITITFTLLHEPPGRNLLAPLLVSYAHGMVTATVQGEHTILCHAMHPFSARTRGCLSKRCAATFSKTVSSNYGVRTVLGRPGYLWLYTRAATLPLPLTSPYTKTMAVISEFVYSSMFTATAANDAPLGKTGRETTLLRRGKEELAVTCTIVHHTNDMCILALSGDGALEARGSLALIAPAFLGIRRGENLNVDGNLNVHYWTVRLDYHRTTLKGMVHESTPCMGISRRVDSPLCSSPNLLYSPLLRFSGYNGVTRGGKIHPLHLRLAPERNPGHKMQRSPLKVSQSTTAWGKSTCEFSVLHWRLQCKCCACLSHPSEAAPYKILAVSRTKWTNDSGRCCARRLAGGCANSLNPTLTKDSCIGALAWRRGDKASCPRLEQARICIATSNYTTTVCLSPTPFGHSAPLRTLPSARRPRGSNSRHLATGSTSPPPGTPTAVMAVAASCPVAGTIAAARISRSLHDSKLIHLTLRLVSDMLFLMELDTMELSKESITRSVECASELRSSQSLCSNIELLLSRPLYNRPFLWTMWTCPKLGVKGARSSYVSSAERRIVPRYLQTSALYRTCVGTDILHIQHPSKCDPRFSSGRLREFSPQYLHHDVNTALPGRRSAEALTMHVSVAHPNLKLTISRNAPGFSHVTILSGDANRRRVFSGISHFPPPFHSGAAPYSPQPPTSALEASLFRKPLRSLPVPLPKANRSKPSYTPISTPCQSTYAEKFSVHFFSNLAHPLRPPKQS
ncbi:hypothetical protein PR048_024400 [Dryococelus australis]|uniref:Uncharacterized protein n=1 Tax=Dryococelus australis TaxID=614101 RepID=A0ABQ9GNI0_9NEOP|nr:hypothetical protein PR048_024400 [Dryococelus australis]